MTPPPTPFHLLRAHHAPLSALSFAPANTTLYAGDQDGFISITDLRVRRIVAYWKGHDGGILSLEEWDGQLISHGRDNKIHFYERLPTHTAGLRSTAPGRRGPSVLRSLDSNSLNFCRFSLAHVPIERGVEPRGKSREAFLAVPSLLDSETVDIYQLPSLARLHSAVNFVKKPERNPDEAAGDGRTGLIMGLHLGFAKLGEHGTVPTLVMGFEDGRVEVWQGRGDGDNGWRHTWDGRLSQDRRVWERMWEGKGHNEAVMALTVDGTMSRIFTVSADHLLVRYDLTKILASASNGTSALHAEVVSSYSVKQIGNASVSVSANGKVVAVGGWDGQIRLFSAATFKPLGVLSYHRETVHAVGFAHLPISGGGDILAGEGEAETVAETMHIGDEEGDEEEEPDDVAPRDRWFASGGKDRRVALWSLMDFASTPPGVRASEHD